jgi:ribosomal protein S18 acetylase RimI-like enzyme
VRREIAKIFTPWYAEAMPDRIVIRRYLDAERTARLDDDIDAIFFEASNTKSFENDSVRSAFRERWLGRYLRDDPQYAYLAFAPSGNLVGYLVGAIDDPASNVQPADAGIAAFRDLSKRYPAHLHVNVAPEYRGFGIGGRLIDAFVADAQQAGAAGVHVVTSAASANVRFYNRNGFLEIERGGPDNGLVYLARGLA